MIPTHDSYLVLGHFVAVILFFSVGAYVVKLRDVLLVTAERGGSGEPDGPWGGRWAAPVTNLCHCLLSNGGQVPKLISHELWMTASRG